MPLDYSQVAAFRGVLKASAVRAPSAAAAAVTETGEAITSAAQANAPVLTGELRGSIHMVRLGLTSVEVRADSDHAPYVEEGTSVMAPEPYMEPAASAHENELPVKLVEHVVAGLG